MPISFACTKCGKRYAVKDEMAGKTAMCGCGNPLQVPQLSPDPLPDDLRLLPQTASRGYAPPNSVPPSQLKKQSREDNAATIRRNLRKWWKVLAVLNVAWLVITIGVSLSVITYAHAHHFSKSRVESLGTGCGTVASIVLAIIWLTGLVIASRAKSP